MPAKAFVPVNAIPAINRFRGQRPLLRETVASIIRTNTSRSDRPSRLRVDWNGSFGASSVARHESTRRSLETQAGDAAFPRVRIGRIRLDNARYGGLTSSQGRRSRACYLAAKIE